MAASARYARIASLGCALLGVGTAVAACDGAPSAPDAPSVIDTTPATDASVDARPDAEAEVDAAQVIVADLAGDFSTTSNPNGAWTFGYTPGVPGAEAGTFVVFSTASEVAAGVTVWFDPTNAVLNAPGVGLNDSGATTNGVAPGEVALHPGQAGEYAIARWTAPAAGTYSVEVQFKEGDTGDTDGLLLHNDSVLVTEASTSTSSMHQLSVVMAAGDRLEVAVGNKGDFLFDSTPVIFTIRTSSP
jgi:hypothetical protein